MSSRDRSPAGRRRLGALTVAVAAASATSLLASSGTAAASSAPASAAADQHGRNAPRVTALFPSDDQTVRDRSQATGRRVALPYPNCRTRPTDCHDVALLNRLDGFDLDPRLSLRFNRAVNPAAVASAIRITPAHDRDDASIGVDRVVYDAASHTVFAHPARQLAPGTTYRLTVRGGNQDIRPAHTSFTTESAPAGLLAMRRQLDDGAA